MIPPIQPTPNEYQNIRNKFCRRCGAAKPVWDKRICDICEEEVRMRVNYAKDKWKNINNDKLIVDTRDNID